jgi:hypothetical protein
MNKSNVAKFELDGFPLDAFTQAHIKALRKLSDRTGRPIPDLISEFIDLFIASKQAESELHEKIVAFPRSQGR